MYTTIKTTFKKAGIVNYLFIILLGLSASSCKDNKDDDDAAYRGIKYNSSGNLTIKLNHVFEQEALQFNKNYVTAANDTIRVSMLRYYFSNVQLKNEQGQWINLNNYNLVDFEDVPSYSISLANIPKGIYSRMRFYVGVDSIANSSGAQEGALNPANNMFWSWATGYIFFKIQGLYSETEPMTLHIGGNKNLPVAELDLTPFKHSGSTITANISFNVADIFRTPHIYDLKTMSTVIHSATNEHVRLLSDNIENGVFAVTSVE